MVIQLQRTCPRLSDRRKSGESWESCEADEFEEAEPIVTPSGKRLLNANDLLSADGLRSAVHSEIRWLDEPAPR